MSLRQVLDAFAQSGPISLPQLARQLDLDTRTLEDMIQFWVRKGKLREVMPKQDCSTCGVQHACPVLVVVPRRYELVTADVEAVVTQPQTLGKDTPACHCIKP